MKKRSSQLIFEDDLWVFNHCRPTLDSFSLCSVIIRYYNSRRPTIRSTNAPSLFGFQSNASYRVHQTPPLWSVIEWTDMLDRFEITTGVCDQSFKAVVSSGFKPPSVSIARAQGSQLHNWSLKKATWIHWLWKLAENCEPQCGVSWLMINVQLCHLKGRKGQRLCQRARGSQNTYREMTRQMKKKGNAGLSTGFPHLQFISSCHDVWINPF